MKSTTSGTRHDERSKGGTRLEDRLDDPAFIARLEQIAHWLDSVFRIPGTKVRFGLDAILGLVPGIGDTLLAIPSLYIIASAHRLGAPTTLLLRMGVNVIIDTALGVIPFAGDLFDFAFKANRRNVALLTEWHARQQGPVIEHK